MGAPRKPLGLALGIAGSLLTGYGIFSVLRATGCTTSGADCFSAMSSSVWMLPAGITLATIGITIGGGPIAFAGLFVAVGLGAMAAAAFSDMGAMQSFGWLFGGMFALFGLLPLILIPAMKRAQAAKRAKAEHLVSTGRQGVGTIVAVNDTGVTINNNPRIEIVMRIEPVDGSAPFERRKSVVVSRVSIPRAGERFPVWYDPADADSWAFATAMENHAAPEVRALFERARGAGGEAAEGDLVGELERLNALRTSGALTDREFAEAKEALLARTGR